MSKRRRGKKRKSNGNGNGTLWLPHMGRLVSLTEHGKDRFHERVGGYGLSDREILEMCIKGIDEFTFLWKELYNQDKAVLKTVVRKRCLTEDDHHFIPPHLDKVDYWNGDN